MSKLSHSTDEGIALGDTGEPDFPLTQEQNACVQFAQESR